MTIRLAIIDDAEVVVRGLTEMLRPYAGELQLLPLDSRRPLDTDVDIALYDAYSPARSNAVELSELVAHPRLGRVVVYSWHPDHHTVRDALRRGAAAVLSKTSSARELVSALKRLHAGEQVGAGVLEGADGSDGADGTDGWDGAHAVDGVHRLVDGVDGAHRLVDGSAPTDAAADGSWPGREVGLTAREAEVIGLITQGLSNQEIAERASLSINSVKSYIRTSYRKMGVTSRTNAVLWGLDHGFGPDRGRGSRLN